MTLAEQIDQAWEQRKAELGAHYKARMALAEQHRQIREHDLRMAHKFHKGLFWLAVGVALALCFWLGEVLGR